MFSTPLRFVYSLEEAYLYSPQGFCTFTFLQPRSGFFTRSFVQPAGLFLLVRELLFDKLNEHVDSGVVVSALWDNHIGVAFAGLYELLVHRL